MTTIRAPAPDARQSGRRAAAATAGRRWRSSSRPRCSVASPLTWGGTRRFSDRRRQAYFHFRHLAVSPSVQRHLRLARTLPDRLGRAAGASVSFPVAFDPERHGGGGIQRSCSSFLPARPPPTTIRLFDGGILDNIPVARAIHAAASSPAQEPVRRWVVYLHPSPTLKKLLRAKSDSTESPQISDVVLDLLAGRGVETLLDDLEVLREHNRESESQRVQRYSLCLAVFDVLLRRLCDWCRCDGLPSVDADHLFALLADPATLSAGAHRGGAAGVPDRGRRGGRLPAQEGFVPRRAVPVDGTVRPFARLVRVSHLSIEWIRSVERRGGVSAA